MRADAYVSAADLKRPGAAADAVRPLIARGAGVTPTGRERFGEALWYVGSVLYIVGVLLALLAGVEIAMMRTPAAILKSVVSLGTGKVLMDVGGSVGLGQRLRLQWGSWFWIAWVPLVTRVLFAHG